MQYMCCYYIRLCAMSIRIIYAPETEQRQIIKMQRPRLPGEPAGARWPGVSPASLEWVFIEGGCSGRAVQRQGAALCNKPAC